MTASHHLADLRDRAERLVGSLSGERRERAKAVLAALQVLQVYAEDPTGERIVSTCVSTLAELAELGAFARPDDSVVVQAVQAFGTRGAARRLGLPRSTVHRIARRGR